MQNVKALVILGLVAGGISAPRFAHAWGHLGHQTIATIGSQLVDRKSSFWLDNAIGMGTLTNVPDVDWKNGPEANNEKPNHWFQIDSYTKDPLNFIFPHAYPDAVKQYKEPVVISNGTAPWRIQQLYDLAVEAFKKKDYSTGLQMAGTMSHYIGDISQPLHVSKNYDGNETGDPGIHKFFETTNLEASDKTKLSTDVQAMAKQLLGDANFTSHVQGSLTDIAFDEINRAIAHKDDIISTDLKLGRGSQGAAAQLLIAKERMADGAATLTLVLERLAQDAGLGTHASTVAVKVPVWIAPQFMPMAKAKKSFYTPNAREAFIASLAGDDCDDAQAQQ